MVNNDNYRCLTLNTLQNYTFFFILRPISVKITQN